MRYRSNLLVLLVLIWMPSSPARGAELDDARALYASGDYAEAEKFAAEQVERGVWNEQWPRLLMQ